MEREEWNVGVLEWWSDGMGREPASLRRLRRNGNLWVQKIIDI
jgi:hypothetical protein